MDTESTVGNPGRDSVVESVRLDESTAEEKQQAVNTSSEGIKLHGLVAICAYCKKIRDDKGAWNQVDSCLYDHSEAEFSHCICPDCYGRAIEDLTLA